MRSLIEMRCKSCRKVLAYIKPGSRIAEGVAMYCAPCNDDLCAKPVHDIPEFLRGFMGGKKWTCQNGDDGMNAKELLNIAAETLAERGNDYDKPEGERSMKAIVTVFNAVTGRDITESEGWAFMCALKQVRAFTGDKLHADSMLDLITYSSLMAESAQV